ncbi:MAG: tRNA pseudouridine synthase [Bacteroidetes bacterium]|nr:tRNA pseudouridine synthase [Bacteroidota bacterium]
MPRFFIQLSYNGTAYHGWQIQENTRLTVQGVLNEILSRLLNQEILVTGCGRTDTGVHARDFYAHFDCSTDILNDHDKWVFRFNNALPADIVIHKILKVGEGSNSRFDAVSRTYEYIITKKKDPFLINTAWFLYGDLNVSEMNKAASLLLNHTDFSSFAKSSTQSFTNNCKLYQAEWRVDGDQLIFRISADRFLRNMVRAIVGTLTEIGKGKIGMKEFIEIIESKNRSNAGFSVPAEGLYLIKVEYPKDYFSLFQADNK